MNELELNRTTGEVVETALRIHMKIGPGLVESVYETILARDMARKGFHVERQKRVSIDFDGLLFVNAFRVDMVVERAVLVEVKSVAKLSPVHEKQLLTYLRLLDYRVGLVLNFGAALLRDGIRRVVHQF